MISSFAQLAWHFLFGWAGVDMLIGFACVAIAVLEPPIVAALIPDLRKWAIAGAVVAFTLMGSIAYGYKHGSDEVHRQWNAALQQEFDVGEKARSTAERDVPGTSDRWVFNDDRHNRNHRDRSGSEHKSALRGLAIDRIRRLGRHSGNDQSNSPAQ